MNFTCICCKHTVPHAIEWKVTESEDETLAIATVNTRCSACGATGQASMPAKSYRAAASKKFRAKPSADLIKTIIDACRHAKIVE